MMDGVYISMRLCHPTLDVADVCKSIGLKPKHAWVAGQPRLTPQGVVLGGTYPNSYCTCDLPIDQATYLEEGLMLATNILKPHTTVLSQFSQNGGQISIFISLEKGVFQGAELNFGLLAELADLRITLEIDRNF